MKTPYTFLTASFAGYFHIASICEQKGLLFRRKYKSGSLKPYRVTVWCTRTDIDRIIREARV